MNSKSIGTAIAIMLVAAGSAFGQCVTLPPIPTSNISLNTVQHNACNWDVQYNQIPTQIDLLLSGFAGVPAISFLPVTLSHNPTVGSTIYLNAGDGLLHVRTAGAVDNVLGGGGGLADPGANGLVYRSSLNVTRPGVIGDIPTGYPYANLFGAPTSVPPFSLLNGGWTNWVDPKQCDAVHAYCAAGVDTTTTGSITSGTNQLSVASAAGWTVGMGIAVAGAVSGGSDLGGKGNGNVCVGSINTLTFSLITCGGSAVNATATVSGAVVNHDDTAALRAVLGSGFNVHLSAGNYNVHDPVLDQDMITINTPIMFMGDGVGQSTIYKRSTNGSVLRIGQNGFNANGEGVVVSDIAILMGSGFTPINGAGVYVASSGGAGTYVSSANIGRMLLIGQCIGIATGLGVGVDYFHDTRIYSAPSGCAATGGGLRINTDSPGGDLNFENIQLTGSSTTVVLKSADTNVFTNLKVNGGDIRFDPNSDGVVIRQRFINASVEGQPGSATCGVNFINHTSDQISFIGGGVGLNYSNGICPTAATTGLSVIGLKFYGMGGYGISQSGGTSTITGNDFETTSGAVNLFGSASAVVEGNTATFGSGTLVNTNAVANKVVIGANNTTLANTIGAGTICSTCYRDAIFTVATLPACNAGTNKSLTTVSDATTPSYNGAMVGGGAVQVPAYCDGTSWLSH